MAIVEINRDRLEGDVEALNNSWLEWANRPSDQRILEEFDKQLKKLHSLYGVFFRLKVANEIVDTQKNNMSAIPTLGEKVENKWIVDSKRVYSDHKELLGLMISPREGGMITLTTYDKRGIAFLKPNEIELEFYLSL